MFPVISGDCRRGGDGERSIDAIERDEGGAGRAWERFGRERIRGSLPPGVGVNGSSIFGDGCRMLGTGQAQYMGVYIFLIDDMLCDIVCGMRYDMLDDQLVMACLLKASARTSTLSVFG